jgi:hypothetical protein
MAYSQPQSALDVNAQLAALHAETQAKAAALVAQAEADKQKKALSGAELSDEELIQKMASIKVATEKSEPHGAFRDLLDIVYHLFSKVSSLEKPFFDGTTFDAAPSQEPEQK